MNENEVTVIVEQLAQHLRLHPLACDSAVGIAQWWLPQEAGSSLALGEAPPRPGVPPTRRGATDQSTDY